ncbi:MAG: HIT domain-containing protein [Promicromonosporaceae bacterium]|nr:HIT domain-containing protein [Promicromonosporaceae bacterium]
MPAEAGAPSREPVIEAAPYSADDCLERLWVPHRMMYINGLGKPDDSSSGACPFCDPVIRGNDVAALKAKLIVARGKYCYAILNLFPYNSGHILVLPYRHVAGYIELDDDETVGFTALTKQAIEAQTVAMRPQGFNLGMNQGEVAGAGIASHLHQHIVPRWQGDANFLPIVGQTKAMPQFLANTRDQLAGSWPTGDPAGGEPVL